MTCTYCNRSAKFKQDGFTTAVFSKKQSQLIAGQFKAIRSWAEIRKQSAINGGMPAETEQLHNGAIEGIDLLAGSMADMFAEDNPKFDREKFLQAVRGK